LRAGNTVHGAKAAGAAFNVYLRNLKDASAKEMMAATYAVKAGDSLTHELPLTMFNDWAYAIEVHGPNGFYRSFTGGANSGAVAVESSYEQDGKRLTGNVLVRARNVSDVPVNIEVQHHGYQRKPMHRSMEGRQEISVVLQLEQSHGWYDYSVKVPDSGAEARFAGRVETGRPSTSDPIMGGIV
jgi:phospholipase C